MRIFALELDNNIKGIKKRKAYIESLISKLPSPDLVVLPELAICSYMADREVWKYADSCGMDTSKWAVNIAAKYSTYIGVGYLDKENGDYYNRYLIAGKDGVCGVVTKSEGESAVFKRGRFGSIIETPFGNVGVGICYDSRRKHFYDNIKDSELSLILFPHGSPADPSKPEIERKQNDTRFFMYANAFKVPVVYINSTGNLEHMPGMMGALMKKSGFRMNGLSKIYTYDNSHSSIVTADILEAVGIDIKLTPQKRNGTIKFYGSDILSGNKLFKLLILKPDTLAGIISYKIHCR